MKHRSFDDMHYSKKIFLSMGDICMLRREKDDNINPFLFFILARCLSPSIFYLTRSSVAQEYVRNTHTPLYFHLPVCPGDELRA